MGSLPPHLHQPVQRVEEGPEDCLVVVVDEHGVGPGAPVGGGLVVLNHVLGQLQRASLYNKGLHAEGSASKSERATGDRERP